jgi:hypothetical protein
VRRDLLGNEPVQLRRNTAVVDSGPFRTGTHWVYSRQQTSQHRLSRQRMHSADGPGIADADERAHAHTHPHARARTRAHTHRCAQPCGPRSGFTFELSGAKASFSYSCAATRTSASANSHSSSSACPCAAAVPLGASLLQCKRLCCSSTVRYPRAAGRGESKSGRAGSTHAMHTTHTMHTIHATHIMHATHATARHSRTRSRTRSLVCIRTQAMGSA